MIVIATRIARLQALAFRMRKMAKPVTMTMNAQAGTARMVSAATMAIVVLTMVIAMDTTSRRCVHHKTPVRERELTECVA